MVFAGDTDDDDFGVAADKCRVWEIARAKKAMVMLLIFVLARETSAKGLQRYYDKLLLS